MSSAPWQTYGPSAGQQSQPVVGYIPLRRRLSPYISVPHPAEPFRSTISAFNVRPQSNSALTCVVMQKVRTHNVSCVGALFIIRPCYVAPASAEESDTFIGEFVADVRWVRGRRRLVRDAFHGGERARYALKRHYIIQLQTAIGRRERRHRRDNTSTSAPLPRPPIPNNVEHDLAGRPDSPPLIYKFFVPTVITLKLFYLWP